MRNTRLTLAAVSLAAIAGFGLSAQAQQIHTGSNEGSYFSKVCPAVVNIIGAEPSEDVVDAGVLPIGPLFFEHSCQTSGGTVDNLAKVRANPADLGIGQFDVLAEEADGLFVIPTGVSECLYVVTSNDSIVTAGNLSPRTPFALPGEKSGSTATFMGLEPFSSMRNVEYYPSPLAAIEAVDSGQLPAAGFVQIPDTTNDVFEAAKDLNFIGVISRQMLRRQVNGVAVYEGTPNVSVVAGSALQIIGLGSKAQEITTACTPVVVFGVHPDMLEGNAKLDQLDLMTALQSAAAAGLLIPDTGDWRSLFGRLAEARENALDGALDKLEELGGAI